MFRVKKSSMFFLRRTALYRQGPQGEYQLFKKSGVTLEEMGLSMADLPRVLLVRSQDKILALQEIQEGLNQRLKEHMARGELRQVKDTMVTLMEETLSEPRSGVLEGVRDMVDSLIHQYAAQTEVLRNLAFMSFTDYTTALHSVNVMALTLGYCLYHGLGLARTQILGLAALLHDVGKTQVPRELLTAPRRLSEEEFQKLRAHTTKGYRILKETNFRDPAVALVALQHHERLDGSGYPRGITSIPFPSRLVGLIDCFEAITADERPYRQAADPFSALNLIKQEVNQGKLDGRLFESFVKTLG